MATKTTGKSPKRKSTSAGPRRSGTLSTTASAAPAAASVAAPDTSSDAPAPKPEKAAAPAMNSADTPAPDVATPDAAAPQDDRLRRADLIEAVAKRVSLKRSEAKMVFDVVLDEIGKALDASDEVVVPPLGKLMVKKRMEKPGGAMLTVKLKRADVDPGAGDVAPLANPDEDS